MNKELLLKQIAYLESVNDHLMTELGYTDQLLKMSGFPDGLNSLRVVAQEMLNQKNKEIDTNAE